MQRGVNLYLSLSKLTACQGSMEENRYYLDGNTQRIIYNKANRNAKGEVVVPIFNSQGYYIIFPATINKKPVTIVINDGRGKDTRSQYLTAYENSHPKIVNTIVDAVEMFVSRNAEAVYAIGLEIPRLTYKEVKTFASEFGTKYPKNVKQLRKPNRQSSSSPSLMGKSIRDFLTRIIEERPGALGLRQYNPKWSYENDPMGNSADTLGTISSDGGTVRNNRLLAPDLQELINLKIFPSNQKLALISLYNKNVNAKLSEKYKTGSFFMDDFMLDSLDNDNVLSIFTREGEEKAIARKGDLTAYQSAAKIEDAKKVSEGAYMVKVSSAMSMISFALVGTKKARDLLRTLKGDEKDLFLEQFDAANDDEMNEIIDTAEKSQEVISRYNNLISFASHSYPKRDYAKDKPASTEKKKVTKYTMG